MAGSKEPLSRPQRPLEEGPPRGLALDPQHPRLRRQLERAHACAPKLSALLVKKGVVQMETEGVLPGNRRRAPATCGPSCFLPALGGPQHRGNVVSNRDTRVHILGPEDLLHTCIVWRGDRSKPFSPSDSALSPIRIPNRLPDCGPSAHLIPLSVCRCFRWRARWSATPARARAASVQNDRIRAAPSMQCGLALPTPPRPPHTRSQRISTNSAMALVRVRVRVRDAT